MNNTYTHVDSSLNTFYSKIYGLVGLGLLLSGLVAGAMLTIFQQQLINLLQAGRGFLLLIWLVEVAVVIAASTMAAKNSPMAFPLFLFYSILNGFTISFTVVYYTMASVLAAFLSAAGLFFAMALVGVLIKKDLSGMRKAIMAGLIGLMIAGLVNMFLGSSGLSFLLSVVSVILFSGIIAYDNQRIKQVYLQTGGQVQDGWVVSMALSLYLNFINLFLNLLRLMGSRD